VGHPRVRAAQAGKQIRKARVAHLQPTPWGYAVGLIVEFLRPQFMPLAQGLRLDDIRVQSSNTIDGICRIGRNPRHVHMPIGHRRHVLNASLVKATSSHIVTEWTIEYVNQLPDTPKQFLEDRYFPGL